MHFSSFRILVLVAAVLCALSAGPARANDVDDEIVEIFGLLSGVDRRSGHEANARDVVIRQVEVNRFRWGTHFPTYEVDSVGNLLVRIPGTGRFAGLRTPVARQAHLDMVPTVAGLESGQDVAPYFQNGVRLERRRGWLRSVGRLTTIGADNGIGVAMLIYYLRHPEIAHPPLEDLYTIQEETTFLGARSLAFNLTAPVMINLDGEEPDQILYGCQGISSMVATLDAPAEQRTCRSGLRIKVSGLRGGHSAAAIHLERMNAALGGMRLLDKLLELEPGFRLLKFRAGDERVNNAIPASFTFDLASGEENAAARYEWHIRRTFRPWIDALADERSYRVKLQIEALPGSDTALPTLGADGIRSLVAGMRSIRNGRLTISANFPHAIDDSSNVSSLFVRPAADGRALSVRLSVLGRGFTRDGLLRFKEINQQAVETWAHKAGWPLTFSNQFFTNPWRTPDNWFLKLVQKAIPQRRLKLALGLLEPSAIAERYPGMYIVSFGPKIVHPHEPDEAAQISTFSRTVDEMNRVLQDVGTSDLFVPVCEQGLRDGDLRAAN